MSETKNPAAERSFLNESLRQAVNNAERLDDIPLDCARVAMNSSLLDTQAKRRALTLVREWVGYTDATKLTTDNPFAIRHHVARFAEQQFGHERVASSVYEVDLTKIGQEDCVYEAIIGQHVDTAVLWDKDVALIGGASRLALKIYAGVDIADEVPINDIDAVISASANVAVKAEQYGIDLTGAKIADGNLREQVEKLITNVDCTMNQAAIYNGKLIFTEQALNDVREGNIRLIAKNDPLFGSEGVILPDGNVYLNKSGFYRGLSFLLRGKGKRLIVSEENLERGKDEIGRYWLILLLVKIMPMKNIDARKQAIGHWHEVAQRLGCTQTSGPEEFYEELLSIYPGTNSLNTKNGTYNAEAQARWIVGKLALRGLEDAMGDTKQQELPATFTPSYLELADNVPEYNYESFEQTFQSIMP